MEIVRNSIGIAGLADEDDLPERVNGQIIQYSETENFLISEDMPEANSIFQILIKVELLNTRKIRTTTGLTVVLDGIKKLKIIYTQNDKSGKANFLELKLPFNTFVEVPQNEIIDDIKIYILDAYFDLLDKRRIYSSVLYLVNVVTMSSKMKTTNPMIEKALINDIGQEKKTENLQIDLEEEYL